jgi:hypothetical protein
MESILKPPAARKSDDLGFAGFGCDQKQKARLTQAGLEGEFETAATKSSLPPQRESVKRPNVPERPGDALKRLAARSREWRW